MKIFIDGIEIAGSTAGGAQVTQGNVPHDAPDAGNPFGISGHATEDVSSIADVASGDRVRALFTRKGGLIISPIITVATAGDAQANTLLNRVLDETDVERFFNVGAWGFGLAPDGSWDRIRTAGNIAPGLGAQNVAPIGGDLTLRASAIAGEADGQSTGVDNLGWVKSFVAHLDVTVVPSGGSPTLEVHIQTQLSSGDWIDIVAFTQVVGSITNEVVAYSPGAGGIGTGTIADGEVVVVSVTFAENQALDTQDLRLMPLGDSLRIDWDFAAGGSTGDYTFAVTGTFHS